MIRSKISKIALIVLVACASLFATEADQFRLLSTLPQEHVQTFAVTGDYIYALSSGNLTVLDAATPGLEFRIVQAIPVDKSLVEVAASERAIALASRNGIIEIFERVEDQLVFRSRTDMGDSVLAMQVFENRLFVAHGYSGTSVVDITGLSHPTTAQAFTESDYAAAVAVTEEFLYVLDRLNGVTVYTRSDDTFSLSDEILTDLPPVDISAAKFGVAICFGTDRLEYWFCSTFQSPQLQVSTTFEFDINCLAANRSGLGTILLGGANGEVVDYDPGHEIVTARENLGYPIDQLVIPPEPSPVPYLVLDRIGNLSALANADLRVAKSYNVESATSAILATSDGLIMSTSRGIELVESVGGQASPRSLIPGFPICNTLAMSGSFLFAASGGTVSVYQKVRGNWEFLSSVDTELSVRRLFALSRGDDRIELFVVGQESVRSFEFADGDNFEPVWSFDVGIPIVCSDVANGLMALAWENGVVVIFDISTSEPQIVVRIPAREHPRDLAIIEDRFIAVANSEGVQIFQFNEGWEYSELNSPMAIPSAFDLFFDPSPRELLIADGSSPVRYLDFSDPEQLGIVYLISNSAGTAKIASSDNRLYCLANNWIRTFERKPVSASAQTAKQLNHSISASPNPFNSSTEITVAFDSRMTLPQAVTVTLVNVLGQTIARQHRLTGTHALSLSLIDLLGSDRQIPSGIYFCRVAAAGSLVTQKLLLLK